MGSKPDFTQKLLNDLRLRKQRMAGAPPQRPHTADPYRGSSRDSFKPSTGAKPIQTIGSKNGNTHRNFISSNTTSQQSVNQIVPHGGGGHRNSGQNVDISMAISYAFDNGGNLKAFELKSNAAMVNLLQQIGKRSMQSQPTNEFPTLTHLHIDEIARGAQKLNHILKACTGGLNVGKGSVEVGKELWKGATDLEQSLQMLVTLQEASNSIIKPQRKTQLKLLEEGEDFDDDNSIAVVKQKKVERPVFSFDKPSKGSHRRSSSCGTEIQQPVQLINSSKPKENTGRLPNVIVKLMGLEEVATEVKAQPKNRSGEKNKNFDTHVRRYPQNNTPWKEESVDVKNSVQESQKAIYKVNELMTQMVQRSKTDIEARVTTVKQQQGVKNHIQSSQIKVETNKRSSEQGVKNHIQSSQIKVETNKRSSEVPQKKKMDIKLPAEVVSRFEPQEKKLRTQNSQHRKKAALPPNNKHKKKENVLHLTDSAQANSKFKETGSESLKACKNLNVDAKSVSVSMRKVEADETTTERRKVNVTSVKGNEIMARPVKISTKTVGKQKPLKQILHGQKTKMLGKIIKFENKTSKSPQAVVEPCTSLKHEQMQEVMPEELSMTNIPKTDESFRIEDFDELPPNDRSEFTSSKIPDRQEGKKLVNDEEQEAKPQKISTHGHEDNVISNNPLQEQQRHPTNVKQDSLTEGEVNLKQKLIQSHVFLNTAEALFKLHIPIGILNYASDQTNHDKNNNLILDCGYELLKKKGRRKEMSLYPNIGKVMKGTEVRTLDNLVKLMHKDLETLKSYGNSKRHEYGEVEEVQYLLNMIERDMFYRTPDLNCMWDLGWNETVFAYADADEVIRDVTQSLLDELLCEIVT